LLPLLGFAQSDIKCNIDFAAVANQNADKLSEKMCLDFLLTIDSICDNNVEFSELSNGTLFKILDLNPVILINTMEKYRTIIDSHLIISMFQDPIDDSIDLKGIEKKLLELDSKSEYKSKIIKSISIAINKY
jgi:hypothetical protein